MHKQSFILFLLLPLIGTAQKFEYSVKGKVGKLNAPAMALLRYTVAGKPVLDSAILENGEFKFKGELDNPARASLTLFHQGRVRGSSRNVDGLTFYLEHGDVKLSSKDSLKFAEVKGSTVNKDNQKLTAALKATNDRNRELNNWYSSQPEEKRKDKAFNEEAGKKFDEIAKEQNAVKKSFIIANPNSWISLETLKGYGGYAPEYDDVAPLYQALSASLKQSKDGQAYAERMEIMKKTSIGAPAPEFSQNDPNGTPVSLSSFRGKYVLVDFWASWCGPCRAENPNVVKAFHQYKDKNFTVLGVSLDQPNAKEKWIKAIADDHLDWAQVSDLKYFDNAVAKTYGINAIPQNFLVDPTGKIVGKNLRADGLNTKLAELIK